MSHANGPTHSHAQLFELLAQIFRAHLDSEQGAPMRSWIDEHIEGCTQFLPPRDDSRDEDEEIEEIRKRFRSIEYGLMPPPEEIRDFLRRHGRSVEDLQSAGLLQVLEWAGRLVVPLRESGWIRCFWVIEDPGRMPESEDLDSRGRRSILVGHRSVSLPLAEPWELAGAHLVPTPGRDWIQGLADHGGDEAFLVQGVLGACAARALHGPQKHILCLPGGKLARRHAQAMRARGIRTVHLAVATWGYCNRSLEEALDAIESEGIQAKVLNPELVEQVGGTPRFLAEATFDVMDALRMWEHHALSPDRVRSWMLLSPVGAWDCNGDFGDLEFEADSVIRACREAGREAAERESSERPRLGTEFWSPLQTVLKELARRNRDDGDSIERALAGVAGRLESSTVPASSRRDVIKVRPRFDHPVPAVNGRPWKRWVGRIERVASGAVSA